MHEHSRIITVAPSCSNTPFTQTILPQEIIVSILDQNTEVQGDQTVEAQPNGDVITHEEHVEETDEHDENHNPNGSEKRPPEDVKVLISSKKHATCELKLQSFEVNWNKISDTILSRLRALQNFRNENPTQCIPKSLQLSKSDLTGLTNSVIDQLRTISTHIRADILEGVAKQILGVFPSLGFVDDDGFGSGTSHVWLKYKMINRNSYLNRYKEPYVPRVDTMEIQRKRNVRAGTLKQYWEKTDNKCTKEILSKLSRDEPGLLTPDFLKASQSYVRFRFDEKTSLKDIMANLPVLRREILVRYHFECATGVSADALEQYFAAKRSKIIDFSKTSCKIPHLDTTAEDYDILEFLCNLLGEKIEDVIILKEVRKTRTRS